MKIISKHKDYYDYRTGMMGVDPTITYDRRKMEFIKDDGHAHNEVQVHRFHVCNSLYTMFEYDGIWYHTGDELVELNKLVKDDDVENPFDRTYWDRWYIRDPNADEMFREHNRPSDLNVKHREPVLYEHLENIPRGDAGNMRMPFLETYNFHKAIDAEPMYNKVTAFLSWLKDNPEISNNQSNDGKIMSHGFDIRRSFRPKMKK